MPRARLEGGVQEVVLLILVVEDESLIQDIVRDALEEGGFQTEIAESGEEAIKLLQGNSSLYRAVLTDINLKGELTGWDVAKRARELNPEIPVVYMTGAAADDWPSHGVPNSVLLNKPFAAAQVVTAVSQLLNQAPPPHD
jgi:CheY-like chemotaxis protein